MRNIYTLVIALFLTVNSWAQAPQKMSYQAVIRNTNNALIISSPVGMQISIIQGSTTGSVVYTETQTTNTNANGLVSIEIGNGTVVTGTFAAINWANGPYFIKTETDPTGGTLYTISGTSELLSVPYALHSKTAESITGGITETDPVFVASPANGITSTNITNWNNKLDTEVDGSVTNEIQTLRISNDTIYLSNGGFAKLPAGFDGNYNSLINTPTAVSSFSNDAGYLTSFTEVDGSVTNELQTLSISNDTIYLSNGGYTKLPAGFDGDYNSLSNTPTAVSSFSNDAGYLTSFTEVDGSVTNELQTLRISNDTIYLSNGGFAKLPATNAWGLNGNAGTDPLNNFIGTKDANDLVIKTNNTEYMRIASSGKVGIGTTASTYKLEVTDDALLNGVRVGTGSGGNFKNAVLGYEVLNNNTTGFFNTAIGYQAMYPNTTGTYNTAVGTAALGGNTIGASNCAYGYASLVTRISNTDNSAYGTNSLRFGSSGDRNSAFGSSALLNNSGNNNTAIGFETGKNNNGSGNVFLGYQAGYNETGSNKLYIANSNTTTPLIYGDFTSGNVGVGTTTIGERLVVQGNHTDGRIATFQNVYDEKYITMGQVVTDDGGYVKYKKSSNYTGIGVHGHTEQLVVKGTGAVGIGTTNPLYSLDIFGVAGSPTAATLRVKGGSGSNGRILLADQDVSHGITDWIATDVFGNITANSSFGGLALQGYSGSNSESGVELSGLIGSSDPDDTKAAVLISGHKKNGTTAQSLGATETVFGIRNGFSTTNSFVVLGNGNVGIGTTNPMKRLHVTTISDDWGARIDGYNSGGSVKGGVVIGSRADNKGAINGISSTSGPADLSINSEGGNVGIGTTSPTAKLEVLGSVKIVDGTQAIGKILTSDATGLATWQAKESKASGMIYRINAFDIPSQSIWTDLPLDGGATNLINVAHSTTTNPERVTVSVSGTYLIQYVIHYRRQNMPHHGVSRLMKNGTNEILGSYTIASPISGDSNEEDPLSTQVITTLSANDYINLQVATNVNLTNEVDSYVGPDLPAPTTKISVSITIVKIGD